MSNKERFEMTKNIDIDLGSIPHPKDCYRVPAGAIIPAGTPLWTLTSEGRLLWSANGYSVDWKTHEFSTPRLTAEPIIPHPTPDDSPIIINRYGAEKRGEEPISNAVALWVDDVDLWVTTDGTGCDWWLGSSQITDWSPTIVTKSGRGVWDERDKRDRVNKDGERVEWLPISDKWLTHAANERSHGSLAAIHRIYGEQYLTGFADDKGGEE